MERILKLWPSLVALSDDLGKPYPTVAAWKQRGNIPAKYDLALVRAARSRGKKLSLEMLAKARMEAALAEQAQREAS